MDLRQCPRHKHVLPSFITGGLQVPQAYQIAGNLPTITGPEAAWTSAPGHPTWAWRTPGLVWNRARG